MGSNNVSFINTSIVDDRGCNCCYGGMPVAGHGRRDLRIRVCVGRVDSNRLRYDTPVSVRYSSRRVVLAASGKFGGWWRWLYRPPRAVPIINRRGLRSGGRRVDLSDRRAWYCKCGCRSYWIRVTDAIGCRDRPCN